MAVAPAAAGATLQKNAKLPGIGVVIDAAMEAIERDNPRLRGVLPKDYADPPSTSGGWVS